MTSELKVGIFTTIGLGILAYMIIETGSCGQWFRKKEGLRATAIFATIAGLEKKAAVRIAGVRVGEVEEIILNQDGIAEVSLLITEKVRLHKDATAAVSSLGLMGEKYVEIFPGSEGAPEMIEGAVIRGKEPLSIDQMGAQILSISGDIKELTSSLSSVLGSPEGQAKLKAVVTNFAEFSDQLRAVITENRSAITALLQNGTALTKDVRADLHRVLDRIDTLAATLQVTVDENRTDIRSSTGDIAKLTQKLQLTVDSLNSILKKVDEGSGTIGKLINEPIAHDKLNKTLDDIDVTLAKVNTVAAKAGLPKASLGLRTEYLAESERAKTYLSLGLNPKGKRYFMLELVHDPTKIKHETITTAGPEGVRTVNRETVHEDVSITAQGGVHLGSLGFRAGFVESGAGLGIDYVTPNNRLKVALDGYDFGRGDPPHVKVGARLGVYKDFFVTLGGDDLLVSDQTQVYFGVGFGGK